MSEKLVTEPHNPFLLETFRAFMAETQQPALATAMTHAHVSHGQLAVLDHIEKRLASIAASLESISRLTDPVILGQLLAMLKAAEAKREESTRARNADAIQRELFNKEGVS